MAERTTEIEWTEHTWNPFAGCSIHSDGCKNCYAMQQAYRMEHGFKNIPHYNGLTQKVNGKAVWTGKVHRSSPSNFRKPVTIKEPSLIFVNSMSDFFHDEATDDMRLDALGVMMVAHWHNYQILTKRPENIRPFLERTGARFESNTWIGVTVENRKAVHRIDTLRQVPAAVRFISFEPLIGPVGEVDLADIHWAIIGGESGPNCRDMDVAWVRDILRQATEQGVARFVKQYGHPKNNPLFQNPPAGMTGAYWLSLMDPVGKGGSKVDGVSYKEWPKAARR